MKFIVQLNPNDYIKANRLHWSRVILLTIVFLGSFFLLSFYQWQLGMLEFLAPVVLLTAIAYYLLWYFFLMPSKLRRIFAQQKKLQETFEYEATDKGLITTTSTDRSCYSWDDILKWKKSDDLVSLYLSEVMFLIIPERSFANSNDFDEFCGNLSKWIVERKQKIDWTPWIIGGILFFGILIVSFIAGFYDAHR